LAHSLGKSFWTGSLSIRTRTGSHTDYGCLRLSGPAQKRKVGGQCSVAQVGEACVHRTFVLRKDAEGYADRHKGALWQPLVHELTPPSEGL